jgi:hypothetical protein
MTLPAGRRAAVPVLAFALLLPAVADASTDEPESATRLEVGNWIANSVLEGTSQADTGGVRIDFAGRFDVDFEFDVDIDGVAVGSWTSTGEGTMVLDAPEGTATLEQQYLGAGELFTIGDEVSFSGTIDRSGVMQVAGQSIPVASSDVDPGMTINIVGSSCEEAWGDLDLAYEEGARGIGFAPDWIGPWFAVEQGSDDDPRADLIPGLNQLAADHEAFLVGRNADEFDDTAVDVVWDFIQRALPLLNEIRNLGECARRVFDADQLEWWETVLSTIVRNSILVIATTIDLTGYELLALVDAGLAANAFGPNLPPPELTADTLDELHRQSDRIIDEMIVRDGEQLPEGIPCSNAGRGCLSASVAQLGALIAAKKMGWDVTLANGETRSAASIIDQFGDVGVDVEGEVRSILPLNDGTGG